ncbi:unnamed protein product [Cyclocybe aegerita]|uniref:DUF6533 domain-containing protein n=1 Tax=Cyclocybe aegerita TaxID=1973307 RepID=A0A8S0VWZ8_CYCAE|nr:unnamed protein product [Cyclocybe aegerita]
MSFLTDLQHPDTDLLVGLASALRVFKCVEFAVLSVLLYDHALTFHLEVERIWRKPLSGVSILFLLNRYIQPIRTIIAIITYHVPHWNADTCLHFAKFVGYSRIITTAICGFLVILRVYALYYRSNIVLIVLSVVCAAYLIVSPISISQLGTLQQSPFEEISVGCRLTVPTKWFVSNCVGALVFDGGIFLLTLWRTRDYIRAADRPPLFDLLIRDGTLYYLVIFLANLVSIFLYFFVPNNLESSAMLLGVVLTSVMVSRIVLNLRAGAPPTRSYMEDSPTYTNKRSAIIFRAIESKIMGNMEEDVDSEESRESDPSASAKQRDSFIRSQP